MCGDSQCRELINPLKVILVNPTVRSLYHGALSLFPDDVSSKIFEILFKSRGRPRVYNRHLNESSLRLARGTVTFSLDFELAWAWRYSKRNASRCIEFGLRERDHVPRILEAFDRHRLPATWATVGHLFLDHCERGPDGKPHSHLPRIPYFENLRWKYHSGDWFDHDPCSDVTKAPAWYAPDLISQIMASPTGHEVASHSFSHIGFGPYCPHNVALAELMECREVMAKVGLNPESFVFPANDYGNFPAVAESGFSIIRYFPWWEAEISLPLRLSNGLWAVHASSYLQKGTETDRGKLANHRRYLQWFIDKAVKTRLNAHLWLHPSIPAIQIEEVLVPLLNHCAELQDRGLLSVMTMGDLVERARVQIPSKEYDLSGMRLSPGIAKPSFPSAEYS